MAVEKKVPKKTTTKKTTTKKAKEPNLISVAPEEENIMSPMAHAFRQLYEAFQEEGFSEEQAYDLLKATINSPALTPPKTSLF
jgi:3-hydroxyisobutyrate dehydrogenase-like beta-hydroxyacid dehydrogenase